MQSADARKKRITRRNLKAIQAPGVRDSQPLMAFTPLLEGMADSMGMGLSITDGSERNLHTSSRYDTLMDAPTPLLEDTFAMRFDEDVVHLRLVAPDDRDDRFDKMAKMAMVGEVSAGLFHDYRNALTVLMGNLALLRKNKTRPSGRTDEELMAEMQSTLDMSLGLCQRIEALGSTKRDIRTENLASITESAVGMVGDRVKKASLKGRHITIENNATDSMMVNVISAEVQMAIINIMFNAIRYCGADGKGGKIVLDSYKTGSRAILTIWNNGPPIPPEMKNHLLKRPLSTAEMHGYGLFTAAANLRSFDADLSFTSTLGGPTFQITFPIAHTLM